MRFTRRGVLIGTGVAGGLIAAWALRPRHFAPPLSAGEGEYAFDAWLKIGKDGVVSVAVPDLEMGQGITTLIPQIVAMELGADWRQVAVEPAPVSGAYGNAPLAAKWASLWIPLAPGLADEPDSLLARRFAEGDAFVVTAEGTALAAHEQAARTAAASARAVLAMAAADRWNVSWEECEAEDGFIVHDKQRLPFGELVADAAGYSPPSPAAVRAQAPQERAAEFPPGAPLRFPRLDLPSKVDGSYSFAGDVRLPDMVHAAIRHGPIGDCTLGSFDAKAAKAVPGFVRLIEGKTWLAAAASDGWAAERALKLAVPKFRHANLADSAAIAAALEAGLNQGKSTTIASAGDPGTWLTGKFEHAARYDIAPALHASVETASATARFEIGRCELWLASQAPQAARLAVAAALDLSVDEVVVYPLPAGGSFDTRLDHAHAVEAALIAREVGKPVQLTWSRWQEHLAGLPRTPAKAGLGARTAPDGSLVGLKIRVAMPATVREFGARLFDRDSVRKAMEKQGGADPLAMEGMVPPYAIPHLEVDHVPVAIPLPTGRLRGNANGIAAFLIETFIDELAGRSGREPLSYRIAMLGHDIKLANCLQRAASLAEWSGGRGGIGQGLACWKMILAGREARIAAVASARLDERGVRVDKITAVADIGRIVNVDIARQQIEGGLIFGQSLAAGSASAYAGGLPKTGRIGLLGLPLLADCPDMVVDFIDSDGDPFDPGELGAVIAPPAIANALASAGAERVHSLPFGGVPA
ncbi:MAG: molybdopterin cofactor-binding domain-containing protein [Novosphingobium sp.]